MDDYTLGRLDRFTDELSNMTDNMEQLTYYGSAEGLVFACVNGRKELLSVEIALELLHPEQKQRLDTLIVQAIKDACDEASVTEAHYSWTFLSEDLCLGC